MDPDQAGLARTVDLVTDIVGAVTTVLQGKQDVVEQVVLGLLANGHLLIEDVPGVGKTKLARALALSIDASWARVQFTPDLLPSDLTGVTVWHEGRTEFHPGAVFHHLVLADEVNRASPKTQAALLEAMEEGQVTVEGIRHPLPDPFLVLATQNPVEHAGTFSLPDSQLDRFLLRVQIGYPDPDAELEMLEVHGTHDPIHDLRPVADVADVLAARRAVAGLHVAPALRSYLVELVTATRRHPGVAVGASPRATLMLQRAAKARAAMAGRSYVVPDDVHAVASGVLGHRLVLSADSQLGGRTADDVVADVLASVAVPTPART